jgi:hypothetical protein
MDSSIYLNLVQNASVGIEISGGLVIDNMIEANRLINNNDQIRIRADGAGNIVRNNFCDPPDADLPCSTDFDPGEVVDSDVDSVLDRDDECPDTDFQPAVVINGIDTNIANMLNERSGCTMMDRIHEAAVAAEDRSDFIGAVALLTRTWIDDDLIDEQDAGNIRGAASGTPVF